MTQAVVLLSLAAYLAAYTVGITLIVHTIEATL